MAMIRRFGSVIGVRPEKLEYYRQLHANPWPEVNAMMTKCHIRNFTIYYRDGLLFSYLEYTGDDYEADQKMMAADPATRRWWAETVPCQLPLADAGEGGWTEMTPLYHLD